MTNRAGKAGYPFTLEPLPYTYAALEPYIDAATMRVHHDKHHQAYIANLNAALKNYPEWHGFSIEELLQRVNELPDAIRQTVHNQGGGHLHHQYFWKALKPGAAGGRPSGALAEAINHEFGSFDTFKKIFVETGVKHFGSGWVFLAEDQHGKLEILARHDHDNILCENKTVLLLNDLWEHAYYLKYQSARVEYLNASWNVANWDFASQQLTMQQPSKEPLPARALRSR